jgi:hypothetical protein
MEIKRRLARVYRWPGLRFALLGPGLRHAPTLGDRHGFVRDDKASHETVLAGAHQVRARGDVDSGGSVSDNLVRAIGVPDSGFGGTVGAVGLPSLKQLRALRSISGSAAIQSPGGLGTRKRRRGGLGLLAFLRMNGEAGLISRDVTPIKRYRKMSGIFSRVFIYP